jgi:hypothetical protein
MESFVPNDNQILAMFTALVRRHGRVLVTRREIDELLAPKGLSLHVISFKKDGQNVRIELVESTDALVRAP